MQTGSGVEMRMPKKKPAQTVWKDQMDSQACLWFPEQQVAEQPAGEVVVIVPALVAVVVAAAVAAAVADHSRQTHHRQRFPQ